MIKRKILSLGLSISILANIVPINYIDTYAVDNKLSTHEVAEINQELIKNWGGSNQDWLNDGIKTTDGGYILTGCSKSTDIAGITNKGGDDAIIVKFDKDFNQQWVKNWGGSLWEEFSSVAETTDGGYIAVGYTAVAGEVAYYYDGMIVKYDSNGNQLWSKTFGGNGDDWFNSVVETTDGGYIAFGEYSSTNIDGITNKGSFDTIMIKYDSNGNQLWSKTFGGNGYDSPRTVIQTTDGGFIAVGYSDSTNISGITNKGGYDCIMVKYDKDFNQVWVKNWGGNSDDYFGTSPDLVDDFLSEVSLVATPSTDGGFVAVGSSNSTNINGITNNGTSDAIIVKFDKDGNQVWAKNFGCAYSNIETFKSVKQTIDRGYVAVGYSKGTKISGIINKGREDAIMVKYDANGNQQWAKNFGGSGVDIFEGIIQGTDDKHIAIGYSTSTDIDGLTNKGQEDGIIIIETLDITPPEFLYTLSPSTWTNGNVTINVTVTDADTGVKEIILPNGNIVKTDNVSYTVSNNGTYYFIAYDNENNQSSVEVKVTNIDKKKPTTTNVHNTEWTNQDVDVIIESTD